MILISAITLSNVFSQADSEFRGPNKIGKYQNEKLLKEWSENGPTLLQTITGLGKGFTSPAVTKDRIYISGMTEKAGYLFSFDLKGKLLWKKQYGPEWTANFPGSRTTPTIVGDKIYFTGPFGKVFCYNKAGENVWTVDMVERFGFREIKYGANESLLIDGDKLYCTPGGTDVMIAVLNRHTGNTIKKIKGNGQKSAHCSPIIVNHNNKKILLTMTGQAIVGIDVETSEMLFQEEFYNRWGHNPNIPIYKDGNIYITTFIAGAKMLKLSKDGKSVTTVWEMKAYDSLAESAIELDGYIYTGAGGNRTWFCIDWKTGKTMYSDNELVRKANVVYADGLMYTYNTRGYVSLIKPNPKKLEVVSQFKVENGKKWHIAHPVIKDGRLYIRHGDILNIYDIAQK
ncbi:MAG: PQQ-binding-like beta-propeller repeat protein [bacterium]|nr:PQQ-binding-like beta-propeller repeat protein [bacterium]